MYELSVVRGVSVVLMGLMDGWIRCLGYLRVRG